jgi:hypothetical protein
MIISRASHRLVGVALLSRGIFALAAELSIDGVAEPSTTSAFSCRPRTMATSPFSR